MVAGQSGAADGTRGTGALAEVQAIGPRRKGNAVSPEPFSAWAFRSGLTRGGWCWDGIACEAGVRLRSSP
jgi:hypothetical protein